MSLRDLIFGNKEFISPKDIYLLFDAGGTIVFPNQDLVIELAKRKGIKLTHRELYHGYYSLIYQLDVQARRDGKLPEFASHWPNGYAHSLFECMGMLNPKKPDPDIQELIREIEKSNEQQSLWTYTFSWVPKTLKNLRQAGYPMSVLSNSDGRVHNIITELELNGFFDKIYSSNNLGVSKPHPDAFIGALRDLGLRPEQVIYIGDLYKVDVRGANSAGLGAIHLDPLGKYQKQQWPGVHIKTIQDLPGWLDKYYHTKNAGNIHPFPSTITQPSPQWGGVYSGAGAGR